MEFESIKSNKKANTVVEKLEVNEKRCCNIQSQDF